VGPRFQDADKNTHETVLRLLLDAPGGRLFDAPSGEGAIAEALAQAAGSAAKKKVFSGDLSVARLKKIEGNAIVVDLNGPLPLKDQSMDYVTCIEGVEHLRNPFAFVAEVGRVLKPGGTFIITTPNVLNIRSRWRFFFSGFYNKFRRPLDEDSENLALHINPLSYWQLRYMLARARFDIRAVLTNRIKFVDWLMLPFAPLVALGTFFILRAEENAVQRARNRTVLKHLLSPALMFGQALILVAEKKR
jgi:SAM-dependent methyltransferase